MVFMVLEYNDVKDNFNCYEMFFGGFG